MSELSDATQSMAEAASLLAEHWKQGGGAQRASVLAEVAGMKASHRGVLVGWVAGCLDAAGDGDALSDWLREALP